MNALVLSSLASWSASSAKAEGEHLYGTAGCGVGALAFKDKPGKIQIFGATLNNLISPQTFAISSGTSNCKEDSRSASAMYININQQALRKDISRGGGESLAGLSKILKCRDADMLGVTLQKSYVEIFPNESVSGERISQSVANVIRADQALASSCQATI